MKLTLSQKERLLDRVKELLEKSEMELRIAAELLAEAGHQMYPLSCNADKIEYVAETIKTLAANVPLPMN